MIVAAAIMINRLVCSMPQPARHHDILRQINGFYATGERELHTYDGEVQGFVNHEGRFFNRRDAYDHCMKTDQGLPRREAMLKDGRKIYNGEELYSEDLW